MDQSSNQSELGTGEVIISDYAQWEVRYNPWVITCDRWSQLGQYIIMPINPGDIAWHIPLKTAIEQTKHASVAYVWRNTYLNVSADGGTSDQGSMLQDFELSVTFNSGNIAPMVSTSKIRGWQSEESGSSWSYAIDPETRSSDLKAIGSQGAMGNDTLHARGELPDPVDYVQDYDETIPLGVQNLYRFLSLADEPRITYLPSGGTKANRVTIVMNSLVFPQFVVFGHIVPNGISWEEGSDHPNSFDVTFTMTVTDTAPKLGLAALTSLLNTYKTNIEGNLTTRDVIYAVQQAGNVHKAKTANGILTGSGTPGTGNTVPSETAGAAEDEPTLAQTMGDLEEMGNKLAAELAATNGSDTPNTVDPDAPTAKTATTETVPKTSQSKKEQAAANKMKKDQLLTAAKTATRYGNAATKQSAIALVNNPNISASQKLDILAEIKAKIDQNRRSQVSASKIPGASRKGSQTT